VNSHEPSFKTLVGNEARLYHVLNHYVLEREDGWCEIYVCRMIAGPDVGAVCAIPRLAWRPAHEEFHGHGNSEEEGLHDCLQKLKGVPFADLFPALLPNDHHEEDGPPDDTAYEDNGHLPRYY
jgi:hypothetical protein